MPSHLFLQFRFRIEKGKEPGDEAQEPEHTISTPSVKDVCGLTLHCNNQIIN
jgi:hypothetical protein